MKQWITNQDGLEKVKLVEVPMPEDPKEGEVLVKINSVSLNFRDTEGDLHSPMNPRGPQARADTSARL